ncbi:YhgE/Pip domain-containing protein [Cohnella panacarvi]|uniref:YhgE/Pip domain-containing protein n=1 Tax=Cohnella panacarvi TaxID=400776 RepID=UPI00047A1645|nr:ABC transporter permease [Cohnella panacarvi]
MALFKQKTLWIGVVATFLVLAIFGVAMMGSVLGAKPKDLPVALVVEDQAVSLPDGNTLNVGAMVKEKLLSIKELPVAWKEVGTEAEAREGLDRQEYYGAFVLPADLSAGLASLSSAEPKPATITILANEGMSVQAATAVKQVLGQVSRMVSAELSQQWVGQISQHSEVIPVSTAKALLTPFTVQEETMHPIGANNASGNAPGMLAQISWIGSLVVSIVLFLSSQKASAAGGRGWVLSLSQAASGIVLVVAVSGFLVWMASSWYGMDLADASGTWLVLVWAGLAFFMLQSALLNWIGYPAMPILILLMFFSMPVVNMAQEFLPQATQDWLYAWTPFKFVAGGLRNSMYFAEVSVESSNIAVLWWIAGVGLALLLASGLRKRKAKAVSV